MSNTVTLIKVVSTSYSSHEEAEDAMAGVRSIPGFHFGYVDPKEFRTVSFHDDTDPRSPLIRGTQRVTVAIGGHTMAAELADYRTLFERERARADEERARAERLEEALREAREASDTGRNAMAS